MVPGDHLPRKAGQHALQGPQEIQAWISTAVFYQRISRNRPQGPQLLNGGNTSERQHLLRLGSQVRKIGDGHGVSV